MDNVWERERSRRLKVAHLRGAAMKMLREKLLFQAVEFGARVDEAKLAKLALGWAKQVPEDVKAAACTIASCTTGATSLLGGERSRSIRRQWPVNCRQTR